jgi:hypothetical protein
MGEGIMQPCLIVWPEYADAIRKKYKFFEVRNYPAPEKYIGQKIGIYASKRTPKQENIDRINSILENLRAGPEASFYQGPDVSGDVRGALVATATLVNCIKIDTYQVFAYCEKYHFAPASFFESGPCFFWQLENIRPLQIPIKFNLKGPVTWFSIPAETLRAQGVDL